MRIGHCSFSALDAALLVSLLPEVVVVRDRPRLATLMLLVDEETREQRPVLLIEALRSGAGSTSTPGLSRGLGDERLSVALTAMHARAEHPWIVMELANEAALSRSAFFARFSRTVGLPPMEYMLAWRMALAKQCLRELGSGTSGGTRWLWVG